MAVVYDRVDVLDVSGELNYRQKEALSFTAGWTCTPTPPRCSRRRGTCRPTSSASEPRYDLRSKLIVKVEAEFLGHGNARPTALPGPWSDGVPVGPSEQVDLDGYLDLYLGLEYRYTKRLSVFLDMSNLSASKYERWYRYPVQRALVLGGATYSF